jgi:hypothetical protein
MLASCTPYYVLTQLLPAEAQPEELNWSGKSQPPVPPTTLALAQYEQSSSSDTSSISSSDAQSDSASSSDSSGEDCDAPQAGVVDDVGDDVTDDVSDLVTAAALTRSTEGAHSDVDDDVVSTASSSSSSDCDLASVVSDTLAEVTAAASEQQAATLRTLHKHVSAPSYANSLYAQLQQQSDTVLLTVNSMKAALKQCLADCSAGAVTADEQQYSLVRYALKQLVKVAQQLKKRDSSADVLQEWLQCLDAKAQQAADKLRKVSICYSLHSAISFGAILYCAFCSTLQCKMPSAVHYLPLLLSMCTLHCIVSSMTQRWQQQQQQLKNFNSKYTLAAHR